MKPLNIFSIISVFALVTVNGCKHKSPVKQNEFVKIGQPCGANEPIIREVVNKEGTVGFYTEVNQYFISVVPTENYDAVIYGFLCNVPEELKKPGLKVIFKGKYSKYQGNIKASIPGQEFYNLSLTEYKATKAN